MGEIKVTVMIIKVDLKCICCYNRVKKVLCKFPQIRDRIFDEKSNTVTIKVFCCDPEMIRYKLCTKGRGSIKTIEIKETEHPKPVGNPTPDPPKQTEPPPPTPPAAKPESQTNPAKPESVQKSAEPISDQPKPTNSEPRRVESMTLYGSEPIPTCCECEQCNGERSGGPGNYGYGLQPSYHDAYYYGRVTGGPNRLCNPSRCAEFFSEENPTGCSVM